MASKRKKKIYYPKDERKAKKAAKKRKPGDPIELVVFDFDHTIISGSSPVMLVRFLFKNHMIGLGTLLQVAWWGVKYETHLVKDESWVREKVFRAFEGKPKEEVDELLDAFYEERVEPMVRSRFDDIATWHRDRDRCIVVVSASFEPIVRAFCKRHDVQYEIATCMQVDDDGNYLAKVDGTCVEGEEKYRRVVEWANKKFGEYEWVLNYAYADHHSDRPLLYMAENAIAVTPDRALRRTAKQLKWTIADWGDVTM